MVLGLSLIHISDLGSIYAKMGENGKALAYIDKAIGLRSRKDTLAILGLYKEVLYH